MGQEPSAEALTYDRLVETLGTISDLLDRAIYLATAGIASYDPKDQRVYALGIVNLLEGPESPLYDPTIEFVIPDQEGLRPMWSSLQSSGDAPIGDVVRDVLPTSQLVAFSEAWFGIGQFLRLASAAAQDAVETCYHVEGVPDAFRSVYAHLLAARGGFSDPYLIGGVRLLVELLPPMEIWVRPGESIQTAIDRIPEGGTIYLEPGTYRETLGISKSLNLVGGAFVLNANPVFGKSLIQGVEWRTAILVNSDTPIEVSIRRLQIKDAANGVSVSGKACLYMENVNFDENGTGLYVGESARAECISCHFLDNARAVLCAAESTCELREECQIQWSTGSGGAAITALGNAHLVIDQCNIVGNKGDGIYVQDAVSLEITGSAIWDNGGYGIRAACREEFAARTDISEHTFTGTITGSGNMIRKADEENGNRAGDVCPAEYLFLKDQAPEE
jgi:hypothetical protein